MRVWIRAFWLFLSYNLVCGNFDTNMWLCTVNFCKVGNRATSSYVTGCFINVRTQYSSSSVISSSLVTRKINSNHQNPLFISKNKKPTTSCPDQLQNIDSIHYHHVCITNIKKSNTIKRHIYFYWYLYDLYKKVQWLHMSVHWFRKPDYKWCQ